jgi:hypothetical protein
VTWYDGVPAALLFTNTAAYPAAAASSAAAQNLMAGATGAYEQPNIPFGYLQQGKIGQVLVGVAVGTITGQSTATTATWTLGMFPGGTGSASAAGSIAGTSVLATAAYTITSFSAVAWELQFQTSFRTVGWGTTTVSTSPYTTGQFTINASSAPPTSALATNIVIPAQATTIDASVNQWVYLTITFSTSSTTNSCTLQQFILYGMA